MDGRAQEQLQRMREQKMAAIERNLNMTGMGMVKEIFAGWFSLLDAARIRKRMKDGGMSATLKRIADANTAILIEVFTEWSKGCSGWKRERELTLARRQGEMVERCR